MRRSQRPIIIASRRSALARAQALGVGETLQAMHPRLNVEFRWIESEGDVHLDTPLASAGGKGLFARAIEQALVRETADIAVHSLKDLTVEPTPGLTLAAIPVREDVRDCLITWHPATSIAQMPRNARFGTASPRRAAQLRRLRPDFEFGLLRGNVGTRLTKIHDQRQHDATLLAAAGLNRLGLSEHTALPLSTDEMLTAAGQGALAIQCRLDDHVTLSRCLPLNDALTSEAVHAERAVVAALGGDCNSAIAVLAEQLEQGGKAVMRLRARVLSPDGQRMASFDATAPRAQVARLVRDAVDSLLDQDARGILKLA